MTETCAFDNHQFSVREPDLAYGYSLARLRRPRSIVERMCNDSEVAALADVLERRFGIVRATREYGWPQTPLNVIECVLSLNRSYDRFVMPRVYRFRDAHPRLRTLDGLAALIGTYRSPLAFSRAELEYDDAARAETLVGVTDHLIKEHQRYPGTTEQERQSRIVSKEGSPHRGVPKSVPNSGRLQVIPRQHRPRNSLKILHRASLPIL